MGYKAKTFTKKTKVKKGKKSLKPTSKPKYKERY